jgi:hypothetical protein
MSPTNLNRLFIRRLTAFARRVHRDERGTISILTVFTIFMFTIVLGMLFNIGRQLDDKLRMQNAADAAASTGGVVISRSMNTIAFSNHLLSEVFALTAYMREGQQRNTEAFVEPILSAWLEVGRVFEIAGNAADFEKFARLGRAIQAKVPLEQDLVSAFLERTSHQSELTLPVLEYILRGPDAVPGDLPDPRGGLIPEFQRAVVLNTPAMAQLAVGEIIERYGTRLVSVHDGLPLQGLLWRTDVQVLGQVDETDPFSRTLPVIDPSPTGWDGPPDILYYETARHKRDALAGHYLEEWIRHWMGDYFSFRLNDNMRDPPGRQSGKMSNLINLWRIFTCGHLMKLLNEEYPDTNLPHVIRVRRAEELSDDITDDLSDGTADDERRARVDEINEALEFEFSFVSAVYWPQMNEFLPGIFRNPLNGNRYSAADNTYAVTFSQTTIFIPMKRYRCCPWTESRRVNDPITGEPRMQQVSIYDNWSGEWDLFNQNWMAKLVPATAAGVLPILQQHPGLNSLAHLSPPSLNGVGIEQIRRINMH